MVALSADDEGDARAMVEDHAVRFPILYGLDPVETARTVGLYRNEEKGFFQPGGFVLQDGAVRIATYSSGPIGRIWPGETLKEIEVLRGRE